MTYPLMDALYSAIFRLSIEELSHLEGKRHGNIRDLISTRQELIRRIVASVANSEFHEHCLLAMDESPRPGSACAIAAASTASTDDPSEVDPARKTFRDQATTARCPRGDGRLLPESPRGQDGAYAIPGEGRPAGDRGHRDSRCGARELGRGQAGGRARGEAEVGAEGAEDEVTVGQQPNRGRGDDLGKPAERGAKGEMRSEVQLGFLAVFAH